MNVEHSDVRACTQGVYSCLVKRLLRDYRQQHPQTYDSAIIRCTYAGRLLASTRKISTRILIPNFSCACANRLYQALFPSPAKNCLGTRLPSARMRSEGICPCVCLSICQSTLILALQARRRPMSYTNGFRSTRA